MAREPALEALLRTLFATVTRAWQRLAGVVWARRNGLGGADELIGEAVVRRQAPPAVEQLGPKRR